MTKKKIVLIVFEVLFIAVIPIVLVFVNYTSWGVEARTFKIAFSGILILFIILIILKKVILNSYLERARSTLTQHKADLRVETDKSKRENLINAVKHGQTLETIITYIFPFLLLGGVYILSQALETAAVQISGTIGLITASVMIGFLFSLFSSREVK